MISPKRRTISVRAPVAIPTAELPNAFVTNVVVREDADMLTMLFPIRIVLISLLEFSVTLRTREARLLPLSARDLSENLLTVVSAVSAEEHGPCRKAQEPRHERLNRPGDQHHQNDNVYYGTCVQDFISNHLKNF